jgi:hypothetical protein
VDPETLALGDRELLKDNDAERVNVDAVAVAASSPVQDLDSDGENEFF